MRFKEIMINNDATKNNIYEKVVYVEPYGGLANRILFLNALYNLISKYGYRMTVIWNESEDCACKFNRVLETRVDVNVINCKSKKKRISQVLKKIYIDFKTRHVFFKSDYFHERVIASDDYSMIEKTFHKFMQNRNYCYVYGCSADYDNKVDNFVLNRNLINEANKIVSDFFCEEYDGVHIRRTDHINAINDSDLESFEYVIKHNPERNYWLASDDKQLVDELCKKYQNIVTLKDRKYGRDSDNAMINAVLDIAVLANANRIYGSPWSTFSTLSAAIKKKKLYLCSKKNEGTEKWKEWCDRYTPTFFYEKQRDFEGE